MSDEPKQRAPASTKLIRLGAGLGALFFLLIPAMTALNDCPPAFLILMGLLLLASSIALFAGMFGAKRS